MDPRSLIERCKFNKNQGNEDLNDADFLAICNKQNTNCIILVDICCILLI